MKKTLVSSILLIIITGCSNPYTQFYTDYSGGINVLNDPRFIISKGEPRLFGGSTIEQDRQRMLEDGYVLLGASSFNAAEGSQRDAIRQAKKIHADTVIFYQEYRNTQSGSIPITTPDMQTSSHSGSIYGSGMSASYFGSSTTYGSKTTYMPYSVDRYNYLATFWIKAKPPRLGIHFRDLTPKERAIAGTNKGTFIGVVVKNSPAFEADLLPGDIIQKFNEVEIVDGEHFSSMFGRYEGRTIRLEISRQGKKIVKEVTLSSSGYSTERASVSKSSKPAEPQSYSSDQQTKPKPPAKVGASSREIIGYRVDTSRKDASGSFVKVPVYEDEEKK